MRKWNTEWIYMRGDSYSNSNSIMSERIDFWHWSSAPRKMWLLYCKLHVSKRILIRSRRGSVLCLHSNLHLSRWIHTQWNNMFEHKHNKCNDKLLFVSNRWRTNRKHLYNYIYNGRHCYLFLSKWSIVEWIHMHQNYHYLQCSYPHLFLS